MFDRQVLHFHEKCASVFGHTERVFAFSPSLPKVWQVLASGWRTRRQKTQRQRTNEESRKRQRIEAKNLKATPAQKSADSYCFSFCFCSFFGFGWPVAFLGCGCGIAGCFLGRACFAQPCVRMHRHVPNVYFTVDSCKSIWHDRHSTCAKNAYRFEAV